jgi:hypothetical protein
MKRFLLFLLLAALAGIISDGVPAFMQGFYDMAEPPTVELRNVIRWPLMILVSAWFIWPWHRMTQE